MPRGAEWSGGSIYIFNRISLFCQKITAGSLGSYKKYRAVLVENFPPDIAGYAVFRNWKRYPVIRTDLVFLAPVGVRKTRAIQELRIAILKTASGEPSFTGEMAVQPSRDRLVVRNEP